MYISLEGGTGISEGPLDIFGKPWGTQHPHKACLAVSLQDTQKYQIEQFQVLLQYNELPVSCYFWTAAGITTYIACGS